jgi:hypothetical protein
MTVFVTHQTTKTGIRPRFGRFRPASLGILAVCGFESKEAAEEGSTYRSGARNLNRKEKSSQKAET